MKVDGIVPKPSSRLQFSLRFRKFVPREAGCYVLTTFDNKILYVGLTVDLYERFAQHWNTTNKRERTIFGRTFWFWYLTCAEKELAKIERTWMNEYLELHGVLPILNRAYSPVR